MSNSAITELLRVNTTINEILRRHGQAFERQRKPGYRNGVEYYSSSGLMFAVATAMTEFKRKFGAHPNLLDPATFNEKIIWSKFFAYRKVPESGNKLMTGSFLPESVRSEVLVPEVVWRSATARISAEDIAPGTYYLKVNHGSGMFRRVEFPLKPGDAAELGSLFSRFLEIDYGKKDGEWWYNAFDREVFLEKSVSAREGAIAWCVHVFAGRVEMVVAYQKVPGGDRSTWFDDRFHPLDAQNPAMERVDLTGVPWEVLDKVRAAASSIGGPFAYVRVDFLIGDNGSIYISELTHSSGNGMTPWPDYINERLGRAWDLGI